jgi:uncharacterized protein (TIGR02271 family)
MVNKGEKETYPIVEEEARIHKRAVSTGKVRVRTSVEFTEEIARANLEEQRVEITRVPVNRVVDKAPAVRTENDTTIIPVVEEVLVVEKQLVLKEELHVRRRVIEDQVEVPVPLRKQRAVVERLNAAGEPASDKPDKENGP